MTRTRRLTITLVLNLALVAAQVVFGVVARSTALLSDAGHNLTDVAALLLSLVAVRMALRPRSAVRSYGNHRATILAALATAGMITAVTVAIVVLGIERLARPQPVEAGVVIVVAAVALAVNTVAAIVLRDRSADLNMRSGVLHMAGDALSSAVVLGSGAVMAAFPSATWVDPVAALAVAVLMVVQAGAIFKSSVGVLLESTPPDVDLGALMEEMVGVDGVSEVHDLHVWSLSSEVRVLSAHLVLTGHPTLEQAQAVGDVVKQAIAQPFSISHSTLELECERCVEGEDDPCLMDGELPGRDPVHVHH